MERVNIRKLCLWDSEDDGRGLIEKIQDLDVIPKILHCKKCDGPMILQKKDNSFYWKCHGYKKPNKKKRARCEMLQSVRKDTIFHKSKLSILQICMFVYLWIGNASLKLIGNECEINSPHTLTSWSSFCREILFDKMNKNKTPIGGPGKIVEIDESEFGKRRYHRGDRVEGQWVFGGVERDSGVCFMNLVEKRDKYTLLQVIKDWILPGTTIMSDCWKAYNCLGDEEYKLITVNKSIKFVDPDTASIFNAAKRTIKPSGRRKHFFHGYLATYIFQKMCAKNNLDPFKEFMKAAGKLYDPNNCVPVSEHSDSEASEDSDDHVHLEQHVTGDE